MFPGEVATLGRCGWAPLMDAPSYRERLAVEGSVLAASGALGVAVLLAFVDEARERPTRTLWQLALVALLCGLLGPWLFRRWTERAEPAEAGAGGGEPTPLWQLPAIVAGLAVGVGLLTGHWDTAVRAAGGCTLVGLTQAAIMAPLVARAEELRGGRFVRMPGSRLGRGTQLGLVEDAGLATSPGLPSGTLPPAGKQKRTA